MALAALYNVPGTQEELNQWSFAHAAHHVDLNRAIQQQFGINADVNFVLDPVDTNDMGTWIYNHQVMHWLLELQLGLEGFDLTDVNWQDRGELAGWIWLNATTHYNASLILGVG